MPEALYRDDVNRFSVYLLAGIPNGTPRSGWCSIDDAVAHFSMRSQQIALGNYNRGHFEGFTTLTHLDDRRVCCAVLDEHAGPLLEATALTVKRIPCHVDISAENWHRELTKHLGAQHGEHLRSGWEWRDASALWSNHLRFLVRRSDEEQHHREPSVGWDPYGDDA